MAITVSDFLFVLLLAYLSITSDQQVRHSYADYTYISVIDLNVNGVIQKLTNTLLT